MGSPKPVEKVKTKDFLGPIKSINRKLWVSKKVCDWSLVFFMQKDHFHVICQYFIKLGTSMAKHFLRWVFYGWQFLRFIWKGLRLYCIVKYEYLNLHFVSKSNPYQIWEARKIVGFSCSKLQTLILGLAKYWLKEMKLFQFHHPAFIKWQFISG